MVLDPRVRPRKRLLFRGRRPGLCCSVSSVVEDEDGASSVVVLIRWKSPEEAMGPGRYEEMVVDSLWSILSSEKGVVTSTELMKPPEFLGGVPAKNYICFI